jgi:hypothetical protein
MNDGLPKAIENSLFEMMREEGGGENKSQVHRHFWREVCLNSGLLMG